MSFLYEFILKFIAMCIFLQHALFLSCLLLNNFVFFKMAQLVPLKIYQLYPLQMSKTSPRPSRLVL